MAILASYDLVILARQPNTIRQYRAYCLVMRAFRRVTPLRWRDPNPRPLGGHYGRTRSLICGLEQLGVRFAYAPHLAQITARAAIVLAGVEELKTAIAWRRRGGCDLLLAGPNIVELPHHQKGILLSPEIDQLLLQAIKSENTTSTWLRNSQVEYVSGRPASMRNTGTPAVTKLSAPRC